eukprot:TRINITY_DN360_c7_g1_i5.p1 TRINITY_DN360_c7_g1~~TRINITY_DN360_c7_g1_i5.p1  ORF type:complete len:1020 (-),score=246.58 TRINITY_DN360_c7_g1_i5:38-3097(-)
MGVPYLFQWLSKKYPLSVTKHNGTEENIVDCDNFYLDMNGIIHNATHGDGIKFAEGSNREIEMKKNIFRQLDTLITFAKPKKLIYMALDGVAPRAKLNQQRKRRFLSVVEKNRSKENSDSTSKDDFDSNSITPGTEFMTKVSIWLREYINERLEQQESWKSLMVILSDTSVPGEGEHKMVDFIRKLKFNSNYNPNLSHVFYGLDADLIFLSLATHEEKFYILRESSTGGGGFSKRHRDPIEPSSQLYVSHLPETVSVQKLVEAFSGFSPVFGARIIKHREGSRLPKAAFVDFEKVEDASVWIDKVREIQIDGIAIYYRYSRIMEPPTRTKFGNNNNNFNNNNNNNDPNAEPSDVKRSEDTVVVKNLSFDATEDEVATHFMSAGKIFQVRIITDPQGRSKGFAYVQFKSPESVEKALELNNSSLLGRKMRVTFANEKKETVGSNSDYRPIRISEFLEKSGLTSNKTAYTYLEAASWSTEQALANFNNPEYVLPLNPSYFGGKKVKDTSDTTTTTTTTPQRSDKSKNRHSKEVKGPESSADSKLESGSTDTSSSISSSSESTSKSDSVLAVISSSDTVKSESTSTTTTEVSNPLSSEQTDSTANPDSNLDSKATTTTSESTTTSSSTEKFQIINLGFVRQYLAFEFKYLHLFSFPGNKENGKILEDYKLKEDEAYPVQLNINSILDDIIFFSTFVGNDFLPTQPCWHIKTGGLDSLVKTYKKYLLFNTIDKKEIVEKDVHLVTDGVINWKNVLKYLKMTCDYEFVKCTPLVASIEASNQLNKKKVKKVEVEVEVEEEEGEGGEEVEEVEVLDIDLSESTEVRNQSSGVKEELESDAALKKSIRVSFYKEKLLLEYGSSGSSGEPQPEQQNKSMMELDLITEPLLDIARNYFEGLQWVMNYYFKECSSWEWYFPYHYTLFPTELCLSLEHFLKANPDQPFNAPNKGSPLLPFLQLVAVLPPQSASLLPLPLQPLLTSPTSPLIEFFPSSFKIDDSLGGPQWDQIVLLKFIGNYRNSGNSDER